jgi:hypothetical protein
MEHVVDWEAGGGGEAAQEQRALSSVSWGFAKMQGRCAHLPMFTASSSVKSYSSSKLENASMMSFERASRQGTWGDAEDEWRSMEI